MKPSPRPAMEPRSVPHSAPRRRPAMEPSPVPRYQSPVRRPTAVQVPAVCRVRTSLAGTDAPHGENREGRGHEASSDGWPQR